MKTIFLAFALLLPAICLGVGTSTATRTDILKDGPSGRPIKVGNKISIAFTGDASDGTVPDVSFSGSAGFLVKVVTNPGATAPTANYDIAIEDANGFDMAGALLADRHTSNTEQVYTVVSGAASPVWLSGETHTVSVSNTSVNSATGLIDLYILFP